MARSYKEPEAILRARGLLEQTLRHLDDAGLALTATHVDMARHCLENEILKFPGSKSAQLGVRDAGQLSAGAMAASSEESLGARPPASPAPNG